MLPSFEEPETELRGLPRDERVFAGAGIMPESLGSSLFRKAYGIRFAYVVGAMYRGIASPELVIALGHRRMLGFLGTGGMPLADIESALHTVQRELGRTGCYGANLLSGDREREDRTVDVYLRLGVGNIEAAAFVAITPALVRYRLSGMRRSENGAEIARNRILAKVSRPEVAHVFMSPPPADIVGHLLSAGLVTAEEAECGARLPMADAVCVEADSGGHTDRGAAFALLPAIMTLRDRLAPRYRFDEIIHVGAAGGIGVPEAAVAAFMMGADFVLTGSINQCTVEAGTSAAVKDLLQEMDVQDTDYAPAADMFETGAKVQVLRKGLLFPSRANRLYELYVRYGSLDEIGEKERERIEQQYFRKSFSEVWRERREHLLRSAPERLAAIEKNPKRKMAAVFKWYLIRSTAFALEGNLDRKLDFQVHCGPALGAFNAWVKGTRFENWRSRHVAEIGEHLMRHTAMLMNHRFAALHRGSAAKPSLSVA